MAKLATPDGYAPYRIFDYEAPFVSFTMRPEQYVSAYMARLTPEAPGRPFDGPGLGVVVLLKDGHAEIPLDTVRGCREFLNAIREFMEADALRNAHNAVMRRGKTHE